MYTTLGIYTAWTWASQKRNLLLKFRFNVHKASFNKQKTTQIIQTTPPPPPPRKKKKKKKKKNNPTKTTLELPKATAGVLLLGLSPRKLSASRDARKRSEADAQLLANRLRLLRAEEAKALKIIEEVRKLGTVFCFCFFGRFCCCCGCSDDYFCFFSIFFKGFLVVFGWWITYLRGCSLIQGSAHDR